MENVTETLIKLIGSEACRSPVTSSEDDFSQSDLLSLYTQAKRHAVTAILSASLINNALLEKSPLKAYFENEAFSAVFIYEKMSETFNDVCNILEKEKIPYIPLKGTVIRDLYPEPWLRSSCDIDILVKHADLSRAVTVITSEGYTLKSEGKHDVTLISEDGVLIELHFSLLGDTKSPLYSKLLENVWDYSLPAKAGEYRRNLSDEMFYYYHIVHMAKHFRLGGCGLRPFLDLWLISKNKNYDTPEVTAMLKKGNLYDFNENARRLSAVWFSGEPHNETTRLMEKFIIDGGSFGSKETRLLSDRTRSGGKIKFIFSRVFVPYDYLKNMYPILKKYPFFTPFCEICRLFSLLFGKKRNLRKNRLKNVNDMSKKHVDDINLLFERVGLN